jgi:hypothetical protein
LLGQRVPITQPLNRFVQCQLFSFNHAIGWHTGPSDLPACRVRFYRELGA